MASPKHRPDLNLEDLASLVSRGEYRRWLDQEKIPAVLEDWTSYPASSEFRGACLAASSTSQNPPTLGGVRVPSGATVYWERTVRYDSGGEEEHLNADDRLIFPSSNGETIEVDRRSHPEHFKSLSHDTGLNTAIESGQLPPNEEGPHSDFSGTVSFST